MPTDQQHTIDIGGTPITVTFNNWAEQANGNCLVQMGETTLLATVTMSDEDTDLPFFPLTVEYEERYYAAGKISGSRFVRREGKPSDTAVANARFIDRAVRPLFPDELNREVQIVITVLSWDEQYDPDIAALFAASLALGVSDIPWDGPVSPVRLADSRDGNNQLVNPGYSAREESDMDVVFAGPLGTSGENETAEPIVNMIEGDLQEVPEDMVLQAFDTALPHIKQLCEFQRTLIDQYGTEKMELTPAERDEEVATTAREMAVERIEDILFETDKKQRAAALDTLKEQAKERVQEIRPDDETASATAENVVEEAYEEAFRRNILERDKRPDGRGLEEIRSVSHQAGFLPRTHGSGLFSRGKTRTISILTLGPPGDKQLIEGMEVVGSKRFMHHYNFPPYAPGEVKFMGAPKRREIGHGLLAERAIRPLLPSHESFPYTIRAVSEVVSSNGSTSMASVCSTCVALLDAGVPISSSVAGIAVGLIMEKDGSAYKVLSDIQGPEDHHGDMDFKAAGTRNGLTALQMDTKVRGIWRDILSEALQRGKTAREHILEEMDATIANPREELSPHAPRLETVHIDPAKIGDLIGPSGKTVNNIIEETGAEIDIEENGEVFISAEDGESLAQAKERVEQITHEPEVGDHYRGTVKKVLGFGAIVEYAPGKTGLVHISKLADRHVENVEDVVNIGDTIPVKVINIDDQGRVDLSLKDAKQ